jgi:hypothetical protein
LTRIAALAPPILWGQRTILQSFLPLINSGSLDLVALNTSIRLAILAKSSMLSGLVVVTIAATGGRAASRSAGLTTLLAGLDGVDLALGELAGADALVWLTVLAEAVVLCGDC